MNEKSKIAIVVSIIVVLLIIVIAKQGVGSTAADESSQSEPGTIAQSPDDVQPATVEGIPTMIELGRESCKPCKLMKPIIADLQKNYADRLIVEFIHTDKDPEQAKKYRIKVIPTQIFLDPSGKELFRHVGFFSKDEILAQWKKLGYDIEPYES